MAGIVDTSSLGSVEFAETPMVAISLLRSGSMPTSVAIARKASRSALPRAVAARVGAMVRPGIGVLPQNLYNQARRGA